MTVLNLRQDTQEAKTFRKIRVVNVDQACLQRTSFDFSIKFVSAIPQLRGADPTPMT